MPGQSKHQEQGDSPRLKRQLQDFPLLKNKHINDNGTARNRKAYKALGERCPSTPHKKQA